MAKGKTDFAVFILSHGRPNNIKTLAALKKCGYTGDIYILVDDLDSTADEYKRKHGARVIIFDKQAIANTTDQGDNFNDLRTTTHVRNAIFKEAAKRKIETFLALDDDYTDFRFTSDEQGNYLNKSKSIRNLDETIRHFTLFLAKTQARSVCFSQGGDFIGGEKSSVFRKGLARKAMNSWFCSTKRPFKFFSRLNEDVNTYVVLGSRGELFFTIAKVRLEQTTTQANQGGMTSTYLDSGTYVKSFYTVMYAPSCVKISTMGNTKATQRLHHKINWQKAVPCIIREKHKK